MLSRCWHVKLLDGSEPGRSAGLHSSLLHAAAVPCTPSESSKVMLIHKSITKLFIQIDLVSELAVQFLQKAEHFLDHGVH